MSISNWLAEYVGLPILRFINWVTCGGLFGNRRGEDPQTRAEREDNESYARQAERYPNGLDYVTWSKSDEAKQHYAMLKEKEKRGTLVYHRSIFNNDVSEVKPVIGEEKRTGSKSQLRM